MAVENKTYCYSFPFSEHLKVVHKELALEKFLANAGINGGFGGNMFSKIYNSVMAEAENMENLYEHYYKPEYDNFREFIGAKFAVPNEALEALMNGLEENENYTLIRYDSLNYGVNDVDEFIYGEEYGEKFTKLFLLSL